jgi:hypothetical protein
MGACSLVNSHISCQRNVICHPGGATLALTGINRAPSCGANPPLSPSADPSGVRGLSL